MTTSKTWLKIEDYLSQLNELPISDPEQRKQLLYIRRKVSQAHEDARQLKADSLANRLQAIIKHIDNTHF